jgi:hypothetical protein
MKTITRSQIIAGLEKHAKRYGMDGIMETARDYWQVGLLETADVVTIQENLDELERETLKKWAPKRRLSVEERVNRLLGIDPEEDA